MQEIIAVREIQYNTKVKNTMEEVYTYDGKWRAIYRCMRSGIRFNIHPNGHCFMPKEISESAVKQFPNIFKTQENVLQCIISTMCSPTIFFDKKYVDLIFASQTFSVPQTDENTLMYVNLAWCPWIEREVVYLHIRLKKGHDSVTHRFAQENIEYFVKKFDAIEKFLTCNLVM